MKPAVVLLSGGMDSATALAVAKRSMFRLHTLSFDYGQRHDHELIAARKVAEAAEVDSHTVVKLDLSAINGSSLTDTSVPMLVGRTPEQIADAGVPSTYVPGRNTIFLSFALAVAESRGACDIFIGAHATDYPGYPDCRPGYIVAFETMANLAVARGLAGERVRIHAPLIKLTKVEILQLGTALGVDFGNTSSCYDPSDDGKACRACDSCVIRLAAFAGIGVTDPVPYL